MPTEAMEGYGLSMEALAVGAGHRCGATPEVLSDLLPGSLPEARGPKRWQKISCAVCRCWDD